jgi:hypothetical protein
MSFPNSSPVIFVCPALDHDTINNFNVNQEARTMSVSSLHHFTVSTKVNSLSVQTLASSLKY